MINVDVAPYVIGLVIFLIILLIPYMKRSYHKNTLDTRNQIILPMSGSEPSYTPEKWNDSNIIGSHNCYAYMLDDIMMNTIKFPQPGIYAQIHTLPSNIAEERIPLNGLHTCETTYQLLQDDIPELYTADAEEQCNPGFYKAFLVVDPGDDYHFYRQDSDGLFSHKPGRSIARRYDLLGHDIYRPDITHKNYGPTNNYSNDCNYFCVPVDTDIKSSYMYPDIR